MKYHDQLKHPLWQKRRTEIMQLNNFMCENCGSAEKTLNIHHSYYKRGAMLWEYDDNELQCLCEICHKEEHAIDERIKKTVALLPKSSKHRLLGYAESLTGDMPLIPDSYEYITGVSDWLAYSKLSIKEINILNDIVEQLICKNKGADGLKLWEISNKKGLL